MNKLKIGINSADEYKGGVYNMLSTFGIGLHDAFREKDYDVNYTNNWIKENIMPHFFIGFNISGENIWEPILNKGMFNTMWCVDSAFYNNLEYIDKYRKYRNFSCIFLSKDDDEALKYFMPDLNKIVLPLAIDPKLWYSDNKERQKDIVFLASIKDPDEIVQEVKDLFKDNKAPFDLYMDMYNYALNNPDKNFWEIYNHFDLIKKLNSTDFKPYAFYLQFLTYAVSYKKRIELINSLSEFNVEVYGNGPWEKHLKGNAKYMGPVDALDAKTILENAKIAVNLQPMQILNGIHDRIMNSSAAGCLVFTDKNNTIFESYNDSLCYFSQKDFSGLCEQIRYYLQNNQEREALANAAQRITLNKHTWKNRVEQLI